MSDNCDSELEILIEAIRWAKDTITNAVNIAGWAGAKPSNWSSIVQQVKDRVRRALERFDGTTCECHRMWPHQMTRCHAARLSAQWIRDKSADEIWEAGGFYIQAERAPGQVAQTAQDVVNNIGRFASGVADMTVTVFVVILMILLGAIGLDQLVPSRL